MVYSLRLLQQNKDPAHGLQIRILQLRQFLAADDYVITSRLGYTKTNLYFCKNLRNFKKWLFCNRQTPQVGVTGNQRAMVMYAIVRLDKYKPMK